MRHAALQAAAAYCAPEHRLNSVICGDVLQELSAIGDGDQFDVVIADPPYNIKKDFGNNADNMEPAAYTDWCRRWMAQCLRLIKPAAPIFIYGLPEILAHLAVTHPIAKQRWLVWHYTNKTVPASRFWQRSHESILCLWKGDKPRLNIDAIREPYTPSFLKGAAGKVRRETHCRYSTKGKRTIYNAHDKGALPRDVIKIPALAGGAGYSERYFFCKTCDRICSPRELAGHRQQHDIIKHPTQKPLLLSHRLLASAAASGGRALIPFAGSGSECLSAQMAGIDFLAVEINPDYVQLANARLELR